MMSAKMATQGLLKITTFWSKGYDVIIPVDDANNKILSSDSNYIEFYKDLTRKTAFSEGWSWFKFINLGLALGINLKFYSSVAKGLKLKARAILEANSYVYRSYGRKTNRRGGSLFAPPPSLSPILNRVKAEAVIGRRSSKIVVL